MKTTCQAFLFALAISVLIPGCRTAKDAGGVRPIEGVTNPSIHVLFDTTRALPVTGTFGWGISLLRVDPEQNVELSEVQERLHRALLDALPAEGFTYTNQAPDYLVGFAILAGASLDEAELNNAYGSQLEFPARAETSPPLNYCTGALVLDIVERENGHLLWRGAIKADIDMNLPVDKKQARCDGAIRELLRHYPIPHNPR